VRFTPGWHWGCLLSSLVGVTVHGGGPSACAAVLVHAGAGGIGGGLV
jgi:hypothetical protein